MAQFWWQPFVGSIFSWWLMVFLLGWLSYPLVYRCLVLLPDRGLSVSKLIGITLPTFLFAVASSRFGIRGTERFLVTLILALALVNVFFLSHSYRQITRFLASRWRMVLAYEAGFLVAYLLYLWFRSYVPDATFDATGWYGAEKWDNLAFLTSIWRNMKVPAPDPWLAGHLANYYYFSHLVWATLAHLSATQPQVAFNLGLATLFALLATMSFGVGYSLTERKSAGWWALLLVAFAGSAATWQQIPAMLRAVRFEGLALSLTSFNFWDPSDVLPNTRNEFPAFNWLLGDLHAHGFGLLILLASIAALIHLQRAREVDGLNWRQSVFAHFATWTLLAVLLATMWATNSWDMLVLGALGWGWILAESTRENDGNSRLAQAVQGTLIWAIVVLIAVSLLASFYTRFTYLPLVVRNPNLAHHLPSMLKTLGSVGYVDQSIRTTPAQWLWFWGIFAMGGVLVLSLKQAARTVTLSLNSPLAALLAAIVALGLVMLHFGADLPWVGVGLVIGLLICLYNLARVRTYGPSQWAILLLAAALLCQAIPEFVFIDDPIGPPYERYNTVFKLYYSSWALVALALSILLSRSGEILTYAATPSLFDAADLQSPDDLTTPSQAEHSALPRRWSMLLRLACALILIAGIAYPILGVASRVEDGRNRLRDTIAAGMSPQAARAACRTLDGLAFMALPKYAAEDDLRLGLWMRDHLPNAESIAEATGRSYSMTGRFAVISGIPCLMGWTQHESQWRGAPFNTLYEQRTTALRTLYTSPDLDETLRVCRDNDLRYVAVGSLERMQFPADRLAKFEKIGRALHRAGSSVIYEIRTP